MNRLLTRRNDKLGKDVWTWSHTPVSGCGAAATDDCAKFCYAAAIARRRPSVAAAWDARFELTRDTAVFVGAMLEEVARLKAGSVVRVHVAGDFYSASYARAWLTVMESRPDVRFYAYTRAWRVRSVRPVLERMRKLANVTLWASTDACTGPAPDGWHVASYAPTPAATAGSIVCPEQTGRKASCSDCGLCWRVRADRPVRLAFVDHGALARGRRSLAVSGR